MQDWFTRGLTDCYQDRCENVPFASIGGHRTWDPSVPNYVPSEYHFRYLDGYFTQAEIIWGKDWLTCEYGVPLETVLKQCD